MSVTYQTEEEQLATLVRLLKQYGLKVLIGIVVLVALLYGYHEWKAHQKKQSEKAASLYTQLTETSSELQGASKPSKKQLDSFKHTLSRLEKKHPDSLYTQFGGLLAAKIAVDASDMKWAKDALNRVLHSSSDNNIKIIASIRLASILTEEKASKDAGPHEAIAVLNRIEKPGAFAASVENAKGDAWVALDEIKKARHAYEQALNLAKKESVSRPLIKLKLDNLPLAKEG